MRKLKHHEQRLLKKVNFLEWRNESNARELLVMRRYHITERDDYTKYNKICGMVTKLVAMLKKLPPTDSFRIEMTEQLLQKLYTMGIIPTKKSLALCDKLSVSSFCRRRLAVVLVRLRMAQSVREASATVQQGHVRVGPEVVSDPACLVSRPMEDALAWAPGSRLREKVLRYNGRLDDFDLLS